MIGIVLVTKEHGHHSRTIADVASNLLLMQTPLSGICIRGKRDENEWPDSLFLPRCYIQRWSDFLHLLRLIAGSGTSTSLKPHMAEAPRGASRCMRNCDPRARLTSMAPNSANTLKSWPPLGSAVERKSKRSAAEGAHPSHYSFFSHSRHKFCTNFLQFRCCGYFDNKSFQKDLACSSPAAASRMQTCMGPFTSFANDFFDIVFTSMFGFVGTYSVLLFWLS